MSNVTLETTWHDQLRPSEDGKNSAATGVKHVRTVFSDENHRRSVQCSAGAALRNKRGGPAIGSQNLGVKVAKSSSCPARFAENLQVAGNRDRWNTETTVMAPKMRCECGKPHRFRFKLDLTFRAGLHMRFWQVTANTANTHNWKSLRKWVLLRE